jgi:hypothetical protein
LGGGPPRFPPDITCPAVLTQRAHARPNASAYGTLTRSGDPFQRSSANVRSVREETAVSSGAPVQPPRGSGGSLLTPRGFGLLPVRSPLLRESSLFLGVLRCFSSPGALPDKLGARPSAGRVAPFGDPRIAGCQRLPGAFRRVATSFIGRQRQGIHHAPIFAATPRSPAGRAPQRGSGAGPARARGTKPPFGTDRLRPSPRTPHAAPRPPFNGSRGPRHARARRPGLFLEFARSVRISVSILPQPEGRVNRSSDMNGVLRADGEARRPPTSTAAGSWRSRVSGCQCAKQASGAGGGRRGGAAGDRTPDLRRAKAALSRLSYGPIRSRRRPGGRAWTRTRGLGLIRAAL